MSENERLAYSAVERRDRRRRLLYDLRQSRARDIPLAMAFVPSTFFVYFVISALAMSSSFQLLSLSGALTLVLLIGFPFTIKVAIAIWIALPKRFPTTRSVDKFRAQHLQRVPWTRRSTVLLSIAVVTGIVISWVYYRFTSPSPEPIVPLFVLLARLAVPVVLGVIFIHRGIGKRSGRGVCCRACRHPASVTSVVCTECGLDHRVLSNLVMGERRVRWWLVVVGMMCLVLGSRL